MSTNDYKGWYVPETVIIVAKEVRNWLNGEYVSTGQYQGYVVDANNKDMLASAHSWAKWTEYIKPYNQETRTYANVIEHSGIEYTFTNEDFTLELLDSANSSSQGGKLSFWNCKISKDGHEFIIGIASDYLLEILLYNDFVKGVCQESLSFARCKGGVGMTTKDMPIYQQFLADEEKRAANKKGKTKKRIPGHLYSTLTSGDVYFSTFYRWYEPVYTESSWRYVKTLTGFRKLDKPVACYWQPLYDEKLTKKSEYFNKYFYFDKNTPARTDSGIVAEIDISDEELLEKCFADKFKDGASEYAFEYLVGISTDSCSYEMPEWMRMFLLNRRYFVSDA